MGKSIPPQLQTGSLPKATFASSFTCKEIVYYQLEQTGALLKCFSKAVLKPHSLHDEVLTTDEKKKIHFYNLSVHTHHTGLRKSREAFSPKGHCFQSRCKKHEVVRLWKSFSARISSISAAALQNPRSEEEREIRKEKVFTEHLLSLRSGISTKLPSPGAFGSAT